MNDYSKCDNRVVTGLIEVLMAGINQGRLAESDALLAALRVLRPRFRELDTFDIWLLIKRKRYIEATQVLRNLHGSSPERQSRGDPGGVGDAARRDHGNRNGLHDLPHERQRAHLRRQVL